MKSIFFLIWAVIPFASAWASPGPFELTQCPLSSPTFKDLSSASLALEQKVLLPHGCEALQDQLAAAARKVRLSAETLTQLAASSSGKPEDILKSITEGQTAATTAVTGLSEISGVFSALNGSQKGCVDSLMSAGDFLVAFVETANSLTPFLLNYGGAQAIPIALGSNILTASVKTFMIFHDSLEADMSSSTQRMAFIENACGYYRFNESVHQLLDSYRGQEGSLDQLVRQLKKELDDLKAAEIPAPQVSEEIATIERDLSKDRTTLKELDETLHEFMNGGNLGCSLIREQIRRAQGFGEFPANAVRNLESLLSSSQEAGGEVSARRSLLTSFAIASQSQFIGESCLKEAFDWTLAAHRVLLTIDSELSRPGRRDLSSTEAFKARVEWETKYSQKKIQFETADQRLKKLKSLASQSAGLEISELLATREGLRRQLFGSRDDIRFLVFHQESPAEGWLKYKWMEANRSLSEFKNLLPQLQKQLVKTGETSHPLENVNLSCGFMENAYLTWRLSLKHVESGQFFCDTFSQTINTASHPFVARYCLGRFNHQGGMLKPGRIQSRKAEILRYEPQAESIRSWMEAQKCPTHQPNR